MNGKLGATAVLIRAGRAPRILHLHLGPEREHTVHDAELVGTLLGMHLISMEKHGSTTCAIGVDNQAAIRAFHSALRSHDHHIARKIIRMANQVQRRMTRGSHTLTVRWTAGHEGLRGNEAADQEARRAAEGETSGKHSLPSYARKPLLINPAAVRRAHHDALVRQWENDWRSSERGSRVARLDASTFLKAISRNGLSRNDASRIA